LNKPRAWQQVLAALAAHTVASAAMIFAPMLYGQLHPGKEAWPILIPALLVAFALETLILFLLLSPRKTAAAFAAHAFAVVASWIAGAASFLSLEALAQALHVRPPIFAWLLSLGVLLVATRIVASKA
jgi:hypothetical protein